MSNTDRKLKIFAGNACPALAEAIAGSMGLSLSAIDIGLFADGEVRLPVRRERARRRGVPRPVNVPAGER